MTTAADPLPEQSLPLDGGPSETSPIMASATTSPFPSRNPQTAATEAPTDDDTTSRATATRRSRRYPRLVSQHEEMNPSRRCSMEDCAVYAPMGGWQDGPDDMSFLGLYDGHGGRDMVEYLQSGLQYHVGQELLHEEEEGDPPASIATKLERSFLLADIHSKQLGVEMSGATVAVLLLQASKEDSNELTLYTANAGDARIVLAHEGKAHRLTEDHRTDDPNEVARIQAAGGFMFKSRVLGVLAITRSLGDHCMKDFVIAEPYTHDMTITLPEYKESHDDTLPSFVILGCDGLFDVMEDQDAADFVWQRKEDPKDSAELLVKEALRRGSTDNITVMVAWL